MKTTEKISLGGFAFVVESDAYEALESYLSEIRECFRNDNSADEIVDDIEVRIAEILKEKYIEGMVVNLGMIDEIRKRIGDPKELAGQDDADSQTEDEFPKQPRKRTFREKRLYRNIDDRVLGGVCSGLGLYFNLDKAIFRLFFLIAFCLGFFQVPGIVTLPLVAYLILWIAMPAARTVEQKCELSGKPMDLKDFRDGENRFAREIRETAKSPAVHTIMRIMGMIIGIIFIIIGLGGFSATIFFPSVPAIIANHINLGDLVGEEIIAGKIACDMTFWWMMFGVIGLAALGMLYSGIVLCFNFKTPSWRPGLVIFILWVASILVTIAWVLHKVAEYLP
ncbi:MAG: PspC domain-containing protein, partial [Bacteroidales bacterium]|nr:PspC domain-containing protein [Bacteroidales bacterium]